MKAPTRFLCVAEEDSVSEILEIPHTEANALQDLGLVVAAFRISIRPRDIHRIEDLVRPVVKGVDTAPKFREIHRFRGQKPISQPVFSFGRRSGMDHGKEGVFEAVGLGKFGSDLKHERQPIGFFAFQVLHRLHQKRFGSFEVFSERGGQLVLFILSDPFHRPRNLPSDMITVSNNFGMREAYLADPAKMRIHITNKVFDLISGFKLGEIRDQIFFITVGKDIDHLVILRVGDDAVILFTAGVPLKLVQRDHLREFLRLKVDAFEIARCGNA